MIDPQPRWLSYDSGVRRLPRGLSVRDAHRLRELSERFALRALACRLMCRHRAGILALGLSGVLGFVAASSCMHAGLCSSRLYVVAVMLALSALIASLTVASLGDPHELERLRVRAGREARRAATLRSWPAPCAPSASGALRPQSRP